MDRQLSISLSLPSVTGAYVILEQEDWEAYSGKMTKAALIRIFENTYTEGSHRNIYRCVTNTVTLYAYPSDPELEFFTDVSHGTIGFPQVETLNKMEQIPIDMVDKVSLRFVPLSIDGIAFPSDCWNEEGQKIDPPTVIVDGKDLIFSQKFYGQVMVGYSVLRYVFSVDVPERDDAIDNAFSSVAYARWDYGVTWLDLGWPVSRYCGGGGKVDVIPPEEPPYAPSEEVINRLIRIDYCTQEVLSDTNPPPEEEE